MLEFYESFVLHGSGSILDSVTVEDWLWWHRTDLSSIPLRINACTAGYRATVAVSDLGSRIHARVEPCQIFHQAFHLVMDWANVTKVYTSSSANLSRLSCFPKIWKFRKFLVLFHLAFLPGMILSPSRKLLPCPKLQNGAESTLHWMQNHLLQLHPVAPSSTLYYFLLLF